MQKFKRWTGMHFWITILGMVALFITWRSLGARAYPELSPLGGYDRKPVWSGGPVLTVALPKAPGGPLYLGTRRGFYRSLNQGFSWQRIFRGPLGDGPVQSILPEFKNPKGLMIATESSLFASRDGRGPWHRLHRSQEPIRCVSVDPHHPQRILIGTNGGITASSDWGVTWESLHRGIPEGAVVSIVFDPAHPGRCYALGTAGLFRSDNSGAIWNRLWVIRRIEPEPEVSGTASPIGEEAQEREPLVRGAVVINQADGTLYCGTNKGVLVSSDEGASWGSLPSIGLGDLQVNQFLLNTKPPQSLYAATERGLFQYREMNGSWIPLGEGVPTGAVHALALEEAGQRLWLGMDRGLFWIPTPAAPPQNSEAGSRPSASMGESIEPSIHEVHLVAVRYAEVMPEKILKWRRGAAWRNWLPRFTLSLDRDVDSTVTSATSSGKTTFSVGPKDESLSVTYGFTWDLANFIWNPDQTSIDVRSRLMVQLRQDILDDVTRFYFERKRLLAEFKGSPTNDPLLVNERALRIEELTAQLDASTGGWFSKNLTRKTD